MCCTPSTFFTKLDFEELGSDELRSPESKIKHFLRDIVVAAASSSIAAAETADCKIKNKNEFGT